MKICVYDEKPTKKVTRLQLIEEFDCVWLTVVDEDGHHDQYLLGFDSDGTVTRSSSISPEHGFQLDSDGRLNIK